MNEFNNFKKKIMIEFLIKCLIISFSLFFIIFSTLFILSKREVISLQIWLDFIIGLGSGLVLFLVLYFIFKPNDKKIAIRLDNELDLNEKVQTMIEYKDKDELIVNIQREDTLNKLKEITTKKLRFKIHYIIYILFGLSCVLLTTSLIIPKVIHPIIEPEDPDKDYTLSEWQILQIEKLVKYVNDSKMNDVNKEKYVYELNLLIDGLKESKKESQMKSNVLTAIANINLLMLTESTNKEVYNTLKDVVNYNLISSNDNEEYKLEANTKVKFVADGKASSTAKLSFVPYSIKAEDGTTQIVTQDPVVESISANENYLVEHEFTCPTPGTYKIEVPNNTYVIESLGVSKYFMLAEACNDYSSSDVQSVILAIQRKYNEALDKNASAATYIIKKDIASINSYLETTKLNHEDAFYKALSQYTIDLNTAISGSVFKLSENIKAALDKLEPVMVFQVSEKAENRDVCYYVEDKLRELFGLPKADREDEINSGGNGADSDSSWNTDFSGGGGLGDGDFIFSSTDLIYDYEKNELVSYGELYDSYYAIINGLINEGKLTEEMVAYINSYYSYLLKVNNKE